MGPGEGTEIDIEHSEVCVEKARDREPGCIGKQDQDMARCATQVCRGESSQLP